MSNGEQNGFFANTMLSAVSFLIFHFKKFAVFVQQVFF